MKCKENIDFWPYMMEYALILLKCTAFLMISLLALKTFGLRDKILNICFCYYCALKPQNTIYLALTLVKL